MARRRNKEFKKGDIVRYTRAFLRSTGQHTGGPINGKIVGFQTMSGGKYPEVMWSDRDEAVLVHPNNLEHDPRARNAGVSPEEKERRRKRSTRKKKRRRKKPSRRRPKSVRLPNEGIVPGDKVRVKSRHPRVKGSQPGIVEDVVGRTVWVRLMPSQSLLGVDINQVELTDDGPLRGAIRTLAKNPAEEIAAAAYAYTAALDDQVRAIRSGEPSEAARAKARQLKSLRTLEELAQRGSIIPAAIGAAVGAAVGSLAGAPGAAVGGLSGSMVGSWFSRPFTRPPKEKKPPKAAPIVRAGPLPTAVPVQPFRPRETFRPREAARPRVEPMVEPIVVEPFRPEFVSEEVGAAPEVSVDEGLEGFEEFFETPAAAANAPIAANPRKRNKLKRRLLR